MREVHRGNWALKRRTSDARIRCGARGCYGKGRWEFLYGSGRPRGMIVPKEWDEKLVESAGWEGRGRSGPF